MNKAIKSSFYVKIPNQLSFGILCILLKLDGLLHFPLWNPSSDPILRGWVCHVINFLKFFWNFSMDKVEIWLNKNGCNLELECTQVYYWERIKWPNVLYGLEKVSLKLLYNQSPIYVLSSHCYSTYFNLYLLVFLFLFFYHLPLTEILPTYNWHQIV